MSPYFLAAFAIVVGEEGGLSMDPTDPGNWTGGRAGAGLLRGTKYGISAGAFPQLDIASVTLPQSQQIYYDKYWTPLNLDSRPWACALLIFDAAVNQGQNWAKTLPADPVEICVARAMHYAIADNWRRFGSGWMRRLFTIFQKSQVTP